MKIHLIMPMGGEGSRFIQGGFEMPKPLIEIHGRPFFDWATRSVTKYMDVEDITFVVLRRHVDRFQIDSVIKQYYPAAKVMVIPEVLPGALCTCLEGIKGISDDAPVLFNDCDHIFSCKVFSEILSEGKKCDFDGALITFESKEPQYSFVRYSENGEIVGTAEKEAVSSRAICGAYIFRNAMTFKQNAEIYLCNCQYKEFFVSGIYNVLCEKGLKVKDFPADFHVAFGTPKEYAKAVESDKFRLLEVNGE